MKTSSDNNYLTSNKYLKSNKTVITKKLYDYAISKSTPKGGYKWRDYAKLNLNKLAV